MLFVAATVTSCSSDSGTERSGGEYLPKQWRRGHRSELNAALAQVSTDRNKVTKAVEDSASPCMRAAGIDYSGSLGGRTDEVYQDTNRLTVERAKKYGYRSFGPYGQPVSQSESDADSSNKGPVRPDPLFALYGVQDPAKIARIDGIPYPDADQGCIGKVIRSVVSKRDFTLVHSATKQLQNANTRAYIRVISDPKFKKAEQEWARCLTEAGYPATTLEANNRRISDLRGQSVAKQAKRAIPDARCLERYLYPVKDSLFQQFEGDELAKAEGPVTAWIEVRERVLRHASRAVASGPGG